MRREGGGHRNRVTEGRGRGGGIWGRGRGGREVGVREKGRKTHTHRNAWVIQHTFYALRASVKIAHVFPQNSPQLVCEDICQSRIVFLLCSQLATVPPTATPSAYSHCSRIRCQPQLPHNAPPHHLIACPCERTPAPCPQCSVQQRRWSPSEPPPLAPQSHSGLVKRRVRVYTRAFSPTTV